MASSLAGGRALAGSLHCEELEFIVRIFARAAGVQHAPRAPHTAVAAAASHARSRSAHSERS
ncbi:hypothetical protein EON66_01040 [archaeon]|nr:MAG: hypothetical protein EON66_01040 [archaeon]